MEKLFNQFCLEGKITEQHAKEIKALLVEFEKTTKSDFLKRILPEM
jgi:hypothetical protein